jgi:hypothetical protein
VTPVQEVSSVPTDPQTDALNTTTATTNDGQQFYFHNQDNLGGDQALVGHVINPSSEQPSSAQAPVTFNLENLETSQLGTPEMTLTLGGDSKRAALQQVSLDKEKTSDRLFL